MSDLPKLSDEEIRLDWLVDRVGLTPSQAREYIARHPKPETFGETMAIFGERVRDLGRAMAAAIKDIGGKK